MHFTKKQIILAIGVFFLIFMGYKMVIIEPQKQKAIKLDISNIKEQKSNEKEQKSNEKEQKSNEKEQKHNQIKGMIRKQDKVVHTKEQQKELNQIKKSALIFKGPTYKKQVALTFDDGPDNVCTPQILDILRDHQIAATFFVLGNNSKRYPTILQRIDQEGHTIGSHSFDHPQLTKVSLSTLRKQLSVTEDIIWNIIRKRAALFRPPYGEVNQKVIARIKERNYEIIHWSVDTKDWQGPSAMQIRNTVQKQISPGGIVLQHSCGKKLQNTVDALPYIINDLKLQGYEFVTVDQLLDIEAYK